MLEERSYGVPESIREEWIRRFSEEMRSQRSEAVRRGMAKRAEAGYHLHRVPVGYRRVWQDGHFEIVADPIQAVHVHQAFLRAANDGRTSIRKLLQTMTEAGLAKHDGRPLSVAGFHSMLTNPFYAGMVRSGETSGRGMHTALVSGDTFERVQRSLRERRRSPEI